MKKIAKFLVGVKKEMKRVRWPKKKEILTYGTATVSFVIVFSVFFAVIDIILSSIRTLVG